MTYDSTDDTIAHIRRVQTLLGNAIDNQIERARHHDLSKLEEPEKSAFDRLGALKLSDIPYGSDEYRAALKAEAPAIQHHYAVSDHHPEHFKRGVADMSLMAMIEMLADWKAAGERVKDGSLSASINHNVQRFELALVVELILRNTARELGWMER